ncbi:MAG: trypsin-like peptidase domain-containing protein, partial [Rhodospirillales bacterium]|nr:trypsin-like peptidase domain-containing protein [Rhodospirillales bacterium]
AAATRPLAFASSAGLKRGEDVFTLGYPSPTLQGQAQKATFGRINALSGLRDDPAELQTDVPVQPGSSGGPLLNRRGAVVGVVASSLARTAGAAAPQNVNYAIKSDVVLDFLRPHLAPATGEGAPRPFERLVSDAERSVAHIVVR